MRKEILLIFILISASLFSSITLNAQDDYKYEIGGMAGTSFYMGDANKTKLYQNPGLSAGVIYRYNKELWTRY